MTLLDAALHLMDFDTTVVSLLAVNVILEDVDNNAELVGASSTNDTLLLEEVTAKLPVEASTKTLDAASM